MLNKFIVDLLFEGYFIKKNINKVAHFQIIFINFEKPLSNSKEEILMFAKFIALSGYGIFFCGISNLKAIARFLQSS